jgi:hypothetical protein
VELFHRHGAYVVFGDVNDDEGIQFEKTLGTYISLQEISQSLVDVYISEQTSNHGHLY